MAATVKFRICHHPRLEPPKELDIQGACGVVMENNTLYGPDLEPIISGVWIDSINKHFSEDVIVVILRDKEAVLI